MNLFKNNTSSSNEKNLDMATATNNYHALSATARTPSVAYRQGTKEAIERVLETVEEQAEQRVKDGFSELNFTLGVLNCFFIEFMFTLYPQHLWLVYLIEAVYLLPFKVYTLLHTKPLITVFYLFDFCWVMNAFGVIGFIALFAGKGNISDEVRQQLFLGAYGTALGPLLGATVSLPFVSLIFHDRDFMTSVFIHFYPPLLFYILKWMPNKVKEAWPDAFALDYEMQFWPDGSFTGNVVGNTFIFYLCWFIPYVSWQLLIGLDLPRQTRRKKLPDGSSALTVHDTVFHSTMRSGLCVQLGSRCWKRPKEVSLEQCRTNNFELRDFYLYMSFHFLGAMISVLVFAYPCYVSKYVHGTLLWILLALCTYRGSKRYTYYCTKLYANVIRKHFADEIKAEEESMKPASKSK